MLHSGYPDTSYSIGTSIWKNPPFPPSQVLLESLLNKADSFSEERFPPSTPGRDPRAATRPARAMGGPHPGPVGRRTPRAAGGVPVGGPEPHRVSAP